MAGRGFGAALMSIGEDVAQFSNAEANRRQMAEQAAMADARARDLKASDIETRMAIAELRAAQGGGGARRGGGMMASTMNGDELMAAAGGLTVPEFTEARDFARTGQAPTTRVRNMTADPTTGQPTINLANSSSEVVDQGRLERIRANVARMRTGLLAGNVNPNDFDQLQKGLTEAEVRGRAFDPKGGLGDTGRRVAAMKGEGEYAVQGNTRVNKFTGETETTEVGESVITRNELSGEAAKVRAAIARASSAGGGNDSVQRTIETGDGRVMVIYRSGRREILTDDKGTPIPSGTYAREIGRVVRDVEKSPWFFGRGKEDARSAEVDRRLDRQFGGPPTRPPAGRSGNQDRPPIDSFFK